LAKRLPSIAYEPPGQPSLFERWEAGAATDLPAPLAVRDSSYRSEVVRIIGRYRSAGSHLVSIGAGNGCVEASLAQEGWEVLATDPAASALRICRAKGLATTRFELLADPPIGPFDVIYCDGVMGHLWDSRFASIPAWSALAALGHHHSICVVSNDLSEDDDTARFTVRTAPGAAFYRPPAAWYGSDASSTGLWALESEQLYDYVRAGAARRREILVTRLLADERIEPQDPV
jgi:hypothetical protein